MELNLKHKCTSVFSLCQISIFKTPSYIKYINNVNNTEFKHARGKMILILCGLANCMVLCAIFHKNKYFSVCVIHSTDILWSPKVHYFNQIHSIIIFWLNFSLIIQHQNRMQSLTKLEWSPHNWIIPTE